MLPPPLAYEQRQSHDAESDNTIGTTANEAARRRDPQGEIVAKGKRLLRNMSPGISVEPLPPLYARWAGELLAGPTVGRHVMTRISKICVAGAVALALSTGSAWAPCAQVAVRSRRQK
jgi:hypothetical protein